MIKCSYRPALRIVCTDHLNSVVGKPKSMCSSHNPQLYRFHFANSTQQEFIDLHVDTLRVVANCLSDSETSQMIHESGGLARLMEFVLITEVPDIRNNAVTCLAKAALNGAQEGEKAVGQWGRHFPIFRAPIWTSPIANVYTSPPPSRLQPTTGNTSTSTTWRRSSWTCWQPKEKTCA